MNCQQNPSDMIEKRGMIRRVLRGEKMRLLSIRFCIIVSVLLILFSALPGVEDQATAREEKWTFKTYPFSDPNRVANIGRIYPYFRFDGYSSKGVNKEWKVICLENSYIKVFITPEIGGKVWGAMEKSTGKHFIYFNKVVKFRDIAMRGPWTSGGIEFNFGVIGHAPSCSTPVDFKLQNNTDGSVSCIVGGIDLPSRTQWRVNIRLPKDKAYFETSCFWYNPTPFHQSYYHWMNAAVDTGDDLQFYFPGTHFIDHNGNLFSWPLDKEGRQISHYKNNKYGSHKSYHVLGQKADHFAGIWKNSKFGFGHWALYNDKPGKKIWLWALSRQGEIWKDLLTDPGNNQYVEIQSGGLYNQAALGSSSTPFKHAFFYPQSVYQCKEIWFPIMGGDGPVIKVNPYGVIQIKEVKDHIILSISPLQYLNDELKVMSSGQVIAQQNIRLKPLELFRKTIHLPNNNQSLEIILGNGKLQYKSSDQMSNLNRPLITNKDFNWTSAQGLFITGEELAKQRYYSEALDYFMRSLKEEPFHLQALCRVAELYNRRGEHKKALSSIRRVLSIDAYHGEANFIYGITNKWLGNTIDALDGLGWAARSMAFRAAALTELAKIYLKEGDFHKAYHMIFRSLDYHQNNLVSYQLLAILYRIEKKEKEFFDVQNTIRLIDPLNHFIDFECYLDHPSSENLHRFQKGIKCELAHESYLELAITYYNWGLTDEAIKVLKLAPANPIVFYWLAYLYKDSAEDKSLMNLENALKQSPDWIFPFRLESIQPLKWAVTYKNHWKTKYYLALILWDIGLLEEAYRLMATCQSSSTYPAFYLARGKLKNDLKTFDKKEVIKDFKKAVQLEPMEWYAAHLLVNKLGQSGKPEAVFQIAKQNFNNHSKNYIVRMDYAKVLLQQNQYDKCMNILKETRILPYEGAWEGHNLYRQANILRAIELMYQGRLKDALFFISQARLWPEHLGVGKPYITDERIEDFCTAWCYKLLKTKIKADEKFKRVLNLIPKAKKKIAGAAYYLEILAHRELGKEEKATELLLEWGKERSQDPVFKWAQAHFSAKDQTIETKERASMHSQHQMPWNRNKLDKDFLFVKKLVGLIEKFK